MNEKYPSVVRRNCFAHELKENFAQLLKERGGALWLAGRVVRLGADFFVLRDASGDVKFKGDINRAQGDTPSRAGVIVEVRVGRQLPPLASARSGSASEADVFEALEVRVLAPSNGQFVMAGVGDVRWRQAIFDRTIHVTMQKRSQIMAEIRKFFADEKFLEVETPLLVKHPGMEPYLDPFKTSFKDMQGNEEDLYFITSPEYALKKLLVAGQERIFQLSKSFRNKETDSNLHNPEFTLLEWYRAYADYEPIMEDTENLITRLAQKVNGEAVLLFGEHKVDLAGRWERKKVRDLFMEYAGVEAKVLEDFELLRTAAADKGYNMDGVTTYEDAFFVIFMNEIEPKLGLEKPVLVYDYPLPMAALAKCCVDNEFYAQRFELYIAGMELCNGFTELNDSVEQRARLEAERAERQALGKDDYDIDQSFISALELGMPPAGGNALGVDRLIMLLTNSPDIRNVLWIPHQNL